MVEQIFGQLTLRQVVFSLSVLVAFIILACIFRFVIFRVAKRLAQKNRSSLDDIIISAMHKPIILLTFVSGLYLAVFSLQEEIIAGVYVTRGLLTLIIVLGVYGVIAFLDAIIKWYRQDVYLKNKTVGFSIKLISITWVAIVIITVSLAVLLALIIWDVDVEVVTAWLGQHGWRIGLIIAITLLASVGVGEVIPGVITRTINRRFGETDDEVKKRSNTLSGVLISTIQVFIFLIAIFMILSELDLDIGPVLAGAGVIGIAIGFGAQSLVKDLLSGLFIIIENQYCVGDVVKIADVSGVVESMNLRRTVLRDLDGIVHIVPNGEIRVASNFTKEWSRVNLDISVAYGEDLDHVISVINRVGKELAEDPQWAPMIITAPQALRVNNLGDSGIDIKILGDTKPIQQWAVMGELRKRLKKAFDDEGIEIPWPHTKVYFGNTPSAPEAAAKVPEKDQA